jgi:hypothetical protein
MTWYVDKVSPECEGAFKTDRELLGYRTDSSVTGFNHLKIMHIEDNDHYIPSRDSEEAQYNPSYEEYHERFNAPFCYDNDVHNNNLDSHSHCDCDCCERECSCYSAWVDSESWKDDETYGYRESYYLGECRPNRPTNLTECMRFIDVYYPDEVNHNCGGHFHVSLLTMKSYVRLCTKHFWESYLVWLREWGRKNHIISKSPFWSRVNGEEDMCMSVFKPEDQIRHKEHYNTNRYCHINYCYAYKGTIEFRVLPMFKQKNLYKSAVKGSIHFINEYLDNYEKYFPNTNTNDVQSVNLEYTPTLTDVNERTEVII